jgi:hypothetical protein
MLTKLNHKTWQKLVITSTQFKPLFWMQKRSFPRRIIPVKQQQTSVYDMAADKEEKSFKKSLEEEEDDINDYLDSALYQ